MCDVPELDSMREMLGKYLGSRFNEPLTVYDIGSMDQHPGNGSYRDICPPAWNYVGLDVQDGPNVNLKVADPHAWSEVPDAAADVIVSGSCIEHAEYFWLVAKEMARIMRSKAYAFVMAPSRGHYHPYPIDCWRFLPDGMRVLAKWAGLQEMEVATVPHSEWADSLLVARKL